MVREKPFTQSGSMALSSSGNKVQIPLGLSLKKVEKDSAGAKVPEAGKEPCAIGLALVSKTVVTIELIFLFPGDRNPNIDCISC